MKKGFSLPLWIAASAKSAVKVLLGYPFDDFELIKDPNSNQIFHVKVYSAAILTKGSKSLAMTFADSGLALDLTRNLEIWTIAEFEKDPSNRLDNKNLINIIPGEGVGINSDTKKICISDFAQTLLNSNLLDLIPNGYGLNLKIIFPKGKFLSQRTSNNAFGIVEGLSIIGTTADAHSSASQEQISNAKEELDLLISKSNKKIIFVIGENGLDIARKECISTPIVKVGNWIGPLIVYAAAKNVQQIVLLGYHGKLIKLAGGIFHTHNHLADARIEILIYLAFRAKIPNSLIERMTFANTVEDALLIAEEFNPEVANFLWFQIANAVEQQAEKYLNKYFDSQLLIGAVLFDRKRKIRWKGNNGKSMFKKSHTFDQ